jgi:DNA mismatch repair ATPase MutL
LSFHIITFDFAVFSHCLFTSHVRLIRFFRHYLFTLSFHVSAGSDPYTDSLLAARKHHARFCKSFIAFQKPNIHSFSYKTTPDSDPYTDSLLAARKRPRYQPVLLTSVTELLAAVDAAKHTGLRDAFRTHTFVGCVDDTFALMQHKTRLYLVNVAAVSRPLMYEQTLRAFSHHRRQVGVRFCQ